MQVINDNRTKAFYTVDDLQKILGIGRNSAYKLVNGKGFPAINIGNRIVIPTDLFNEWVSRQAARQKEVS